MSRSLRIKGGTTDEVFQEQFFWVVERSFGLFNFQYLVHTQEPMKHTKGKEKNKKAQ